MVIDLVCIKWDEGDTDTPETADPVEPGNPDEDSPSGDGPSDSKPPEKTEYEKWKEKAEKIQTENAKERQRYIDALKKQNELVMSGACGFRIAGPSTGQECPAITPPDLTEIPDPPAGAPPIDEVLPPIPPQDAAYVAISAVLKIAPSAINIGPDPDASRWEQAVVNHPYWLWASGPTSYGPVSDSSAGMKVTIKANLRKTNFDMGDGFLVKCKGAGTPYPGDTAGLGKESPTCGYTFKKMSRNEPGGKYTVRATTYWDVSYSTPVGSGTIPIVLATERQVLVGELQTVVDG